MDLLNDLYNDIKKNNIELLNYKFTNIQAVTIEIEKDFGIVVNYSNIDTLSGEFDIVAHEYGHCCTGTTHKLSSPLQSTEKHEYYANKFIVHKYLPFDRIRQAAEKGYESRYELSEHLGFSEDFIQLALDVYKREGLIY